MKNNIIFSIFKKAIFTFPTILLLNIFIVNTALAASPFSCTAESFLFNSNGTNDPAYASSIDLKTGVATQLNNSNSFHDRDMNAIGYNVVDNYIWGYDRARNKVARINSNFNVELFTIPNLPQNAFHIADVSQKGVFFLADQWIDKGSIYKVNVNPSSPKYKKYVGKLTLKHPNGTAYSDFFTRIADLAFNPIDKKIYTINSSGQIFKIHPQSGKVTTVINVGNLGANAVAVFFDKDGYFYYNANGAIYRVDVLNPVVPNGPFSNLSINAEGDAARCPNAGIEINTPSKGPGTLRYANSGLGKYKDRILFMDWKNSSLKDGIQDGDIVEFDIPEASCMPNGTLTATFSNIDDPGNIAIHTKPTDMKTWDGSGFYKLYDTAGQGEAIYTTVYMLEEDEESINLGFTITWNMVINGETINPDIFLIDAESTTDHSEQIDATTNGGVWSVIENAQSNTYEVDGLGTHQVNIKNTEHPSPYEVEGWSPLLLSKGMTRTTINIKNFDSDHGKEGVAFGLLVPCDHGDAPSTYGDAAHAFLEEAISPSKNQLGLKFTEGTSYFGETPPDSELSGQNNASAEADDDNKDPYDTTRDDDENIEIIKLPAGNSIQIIVPVNGSGLLNAWFDWNADGDFGDEHEQVVNDASVSTGNTTLTLNIPSDASIGESFARFRISTQPNLLSTGYAKDGEVEDIAVEIIEGGICRVDDLTESIYSTASVSANSSFLSDSTRVYQAKFNSANWEGHILAYDLETNDDDGNVKSLKWDAADQMSRTGRKLFTYNPQLASNRGKVFGWSNLNSSQKSILKKEQTTAKGQKRLNWVKGANNDEGSFLRTRSNILGDIINSNLMFKDTLANYGYSNLPEGSTYDAFLGTKQSSTPTIFAAANDGMLHAFNASDGSELFSYVPNEVFPKLVTISDPLYGCNGAGCLPHEYLVDGKSSIGDAYFGSSSDWHTVLVGGLGKGGKGLFALDISDTSNFSAGNVLWEISSTQATSAGSNENEIKNNLGDALTSASIVRMNNSDANKRWAAVIGNGYGSANYKAVLLIIDIETGALIKKIDTGSGSVDAPNGLSSPIAVDSNNDSIVDRIYAGDLLGNLWAFDVSGSNTNSWGVDFGGAALFNTSQAITAPPQVGRNPIGGLMVYFGTGRYDDVSDNLYEGAPISNTYYGIHDNGSPVASSALIEQTILQESAADATNYNVRISTKHPVNYSTHNGWYMDLPSAGERVISQALLRQGRLIFTTMTPPGNICAWGGTSWLMEFDAVEGKRLDVVPIDINNDKEFNEADNVLYQGDNTILSGVQDTALGVVFSTPAVITHNTRTEGKYLTGTGGSIGMFRESASAASGRMSWRQIR